MHRFVVAMLAIVLLTASLAAESTRKLLAEGAHLSDADATKLEASLEQSPTNHDARLTLLAYWTTRPETAGAATVKAARARHITWIVQHWPQDEIFGIAPRLTRIYTAGLWADPDSFDKVSKIWLEQAK